jgi:hypothetical protein
MNGFTKIENVQISELAIALADAPRKSRDSIIQAMELAYKSGRIDGSIELANKMLAAKPGAEVS